MNIKLLLSIVIYSSLHHFSIAQSPLPTNWHKTNNDSIRGVKSEEALSFLKQSEIKPFGEIVVGIIDSGVDTTVVEIKKSLWTNKSEKKDGKDNDNNGYIDDLHGWNFLGTDDGNFNMISAGTEEYRQFKALYPKYKDPTVIVKDSAEFALYQKMKNKAGIETYLKFFEYNKLKNESYNYIDSVLSKNKDIVLDTLTINGVLNYNTEDTLWVNSTSMIFMDFFSLGKNELWNNALKKHESDFELIKNRIHGIEHDTDKRLLIGDEMHDEMDIFYGNPNLQVDGFEHGTTVAGVTSGVYPKAKLMIIRALPEGDEYDKDISSAIRYAVNNGAKVINMSFGKYTSPNSEMVNNAISYAAEKDVLLIHSAGNNGLNIDSVDYFPSATDNTGDRFSNLLRVGATDLQGNRSSLSNYGVNNVDLFAPGENIISISAGGKQTVSQGTSVSAPIVTAVAAMIRHYFPSLKASEVKEILLKSVTAMEEEGLSVSGGYLNAFEAVKIALEIQ